MKSNFFAARMIAKLVKSKLVFYSSILGLAMSFQVTTGSSPAHALKLYAQQNGNIACSTCHTTRGISNGNMKEFTTAGNYYKNNNRLPQNNNGNGWGNNNNGGNNNGNGWGNNNNGGNNNNNGNSWGNNNNGGNNNGNGWGNNNNNGNSRGNSSNNFSCGRGFRTEDNTDYQGNDIQGFRDNFSSCTQRCRDNWRCRGLSWIKTRANKKCWLKFNMNRSSYKRHVVSCVKR